MERGEPELGEVLLQRFLVELVHASPTPQHTLALLRGAQAGFLAHGWWLSLPNLSRLGGPGLTSVAITAEIVERIRAGTAHPVIAAGVVLALFTGVQALSLGPLPLDAVRAPTQLLAMPFQSQSVGAVHRREYGPGIPTDVTTAVFHIPRPARPLLRAARAFLAMRSDDPRQRVFAGLSSMHEVVEQAAARCGIPLPRRAPGRHLADAREPHPPR